MRVCLKLRILEGIWKENWDKGKYFHVGMIPFYVAKFAVDPITTLLDLFNIINSTLYLLFLTSN